MNLQTAIRRIKKYKPTTPSEFKWAGVPLGECLGAGSFREVVKVKDCDLVVKFPLSEDTILPGKEPDRHWGKVHTTAEVKKIGRLAKLPWMRKYLPKIYYHDRKSGVLVMRYYTEISQHDFLNATHQLLQTFFEHATGETMGDYGEGNVLQTAGGNPRLILIDLGY